MLRGRHRVDTRVCAVRKCVVCRNLLRYFPCTDLEFGRRCYMHFRLKFLSQKRYEIGTDAVNTKHPVARVSWVSQHQLSFFLLETIGYASISSQTWSGPWQPFPSLSYFLSPPFPYLIHIPFNEGSGITPEFFFDFTDARRRV